ncbi:MAG: hypothetical protein MUO91_00985 [candidate division Zixibacteria bacterium]|nr:hypothetical protein [candidate division Zixibacteria bacterium]
MKYLKDLIEKFMDFVNTEEGEKWRKERDERKKLYFTLRSKNYIKKLTEEEFRIVIKALWASNFWGNKDWLVNRILERNGGIEKIRESLSDLLHGEDPLHKRYDNFRQSIKGIGPAMLTEIMAFVVPKEYCIWNEKPKAVLPFLEMKNLLPDRVFKHQISGSDYESCIKTLSKIKEELEATVSTPDFIHVDFFLAFIFYKILPQQVYICPICEAKFNIQSELDAHVVTAHPKPPPSKEEMSAHTKAQQALIELGNLLGFDTYLPPEDRGKIEIATLKEIPQFTHLHLLDTAKHIDVIWFREEFPVYCFEVEESTDVTKGLLRLYQIKKLKITPIIVGPENKRIKFQMEIEKEPFRSIKKSYKFISYEELSKLIEISKQFYELKKKLLGEVI